MQLTAPVSTDISYVIGQVWIYSGAIYVNVGQGTRLRGGDTLASTTVSGSVFLSTYHQ